MGSKNDAASSSSQSLSIAPPPLPTTVVISYTSTADNIASGIGVTSTPTFSTTVVPLTLVVSGGQTFRLSAGKTFVYTQQQTLFSQPTATTAPLLTQKSRGTINTGTAAGIAIGCLVFGALVAVAIFLFLRKKKRLREIGIPNAMGKKNEYEKAELGTDEEVVKRKPTVRYELADKSISEMANGPTKPVELKGCDPQPGELNGEEVTTSRRDSS